MNLKNKIGEREKIGKNLSNMCIKTFLLQKIIFLLVRENKSKKKMFSFFFETKPKILYNQLKIFSENYFSWESIEKIIFCYTWINIADDDEEKIFTSATFNHVCQNFLN